MKLSEAFGDDIRLLNFRFCACVEQRAGGGGERRS
jgi:hypothetical protein